MIRSHVRAARSAVRLACQAAPAFLIVYGIATLIQAVNPVASAWLTKVLMDALAGGTSLAPVLTPALLLAGTGAVAALLPHLQTFFREQVGRRTGVRAQDELFARVEAFDGLGRFEDPSFQDRLRLAQQAAGLTSSQLITDLFALIAGLFTIAGFVATLAVISPVMVAVVLLAVIPVLLAELAMARRRAGMMWQLGPMERREMFYGQLLSSTQAAKEVRLFGMGHFLRSRMRSERLAINKVRTGRELRELRVQSALAMLSTAVAGGGLVWFVLRAVRGQFSVGDLSMFLATVVGVQAALVSVAQAVARTHQQLILFGHYQHVVTAGPDLPRPERPTGVGALRTGIELRDVWFRYSEDHPWVLSGVDLFIPHGAAVALVGRNGAGKSTLIKLLCRLYDPTRGTILWDGVDIRTMDPAALRARIGVLFQDFMHYDLTARENIALGDIAALDDRARIERAAQLAGIHGTLAALPRGYDTLLTRMFKGQDDSDDPATGVILSGGQWQRLAFARALLRDRKDLMILDEPSSGLDAMAEHEVHTTIRAHREGATSVLISHRLGTVREAEMIAVLSEGRVVETGTHDELIDRDGQYAALFRLQARGYVDSDQTATVGRSGWSASATA